MFDSAFLHSPLFNWVILPILIFISRMTDVTLGTLRHIFLAKGIKKIVPVLGFFEVLIWLIVIGQIMKNLNNFMCYFAWAGGFAAGTFVGMFVEEKLAIGIQVIRIITNQNCDPLIATLKQANLGVTVIDGTGSTGPVKIIFTVIKRKDLDEVVKSIHSYNPTAFYSVEDVKDVAKGVFPGVGGTRKTSYFSQLMSSGK